MQVQPEVKHFQQAVEDQVEQVLETALRARSTLTQGDCLSIPFADEVFRLRVTSLAPDPQVSVIGMPLWQPSLQPAWQCRLSSISRL